MSTIRNSTVTIQSCEDCMHKTHAQASKHECKLARSLDDETVTVIMNSSGRAVACYENPAREEKASLSLKG